MSSRWALRNKRASVRIGLAVAAAGLLVVACGEKDEPEPSPVPPSEVVTEAVEHTLAAGSSEFQVRVESGRVSYRIPDTLDVNSRWYRARVPQVRRGRISPRSAWLAATGPAFTFGGADTGRAYIGPITAGKGAPCWVEAHAPAGSVPGAMSAEEALVLAHTALALLQGEAHAEASGRGYAVDIPPPNRDATVDFAVPPNADVTNRYIRELRRAGRRVIESISEPVLVSVGEDGHVDSLRLRAAAGPSPLTFTPRRPGTTVTLELVGPGGGERVVPPKCLGME